VILALTGSNCLFLDVKINQLPVRLLVDTGAEKSLLDHQTARRVMVTKPEDNNFTLKSANGGVMANYGSVNANMRVGSHSYRGDFIITDLQEGISGIMGSDLMRHMNCFLGIQEQSIRIGEEVLPLQRSADMAITCARVSLSLNIEPGQAAMVPINMLKTTQKDDTLYLFEPDRRACLEKGLQAPRAIYNAGRRPSVLVVNCGDEVAVVQDTDDIGSVESIEVGSDNECTINNNEVAQKDTDANKVPEHLEHLIHSELDEDQKRQLSELICKYDDCFVGGKYGLGNTSIEEHTITTQCSKPVKTPVRLLPLSKRKVADELIKELLEKDLIEPSTSPWSSPVVIVKKKDGSHRLCIDYRALNKVCPAENFPMVRQETIRESVAGAKWFSTLDMASGYHQINVKKEDRPKTAFSTNQGHYQFKVMSFGLCNAPSTFTRIMQTLLQNLQPDQCLAYLDDIITWGSTFDEAIMRLETILSRLRAANLRLKPKKCELFKTSVNYLGYVMSRDGLKTDPDKVAAVKNWCTPHDIHSLRQFLGFMNYYRSFLANYNEVAEPLLALTRKSVRYSWTETCEEAFNKLKQLLLDAPTLAYPVPDAQFILDTDASGTQIGAVLSQVIDGEERPICYASHTLESTRRTYCTTYRELYAVIFYLRKFKHYLYGQTITVRTDHNALKWLLNFRDSEGMLGRWLTTLAEVDMEIIHRPGRLHTNADIMSRKEPCGRLDCPDCSRKTKQVSTSNHLVVCERYRDANPPEEEVDREIPEDDELIHLDVEGTEDEPQNENTNEVGARDEPPEYTLGLDGLPFLGQRTRAGRAVRPPRRLADFV